MRPRIKYLLAFALIFTILAGIRFGISTRSHIVNVLLFFSVFVGYAYIAFGAFALQPRRFGLALGTVLSIPVAVSILASPLILFVAYWTLNDSARGPDTVIPMADGLLCAEYSSGSVVTEADETFELDRPMLGVFLIRLAVDSGPIRDNYSVQTGCASVYQTWQSSRLASTK